MRTREPSVLKGTRLSHLRQSRLLAGEISESDLSERT
jgi:hypothetical protein